MLSIYMFVKWKPQTACLNNFFEFHLLWLILVFDWIKKFSFKTEFVRKIQNNNEFNPIGFYLELKVNNPKYLLAIAIILRLFWTFQFIIVIWVLVKFTKTTKYVICPILNFSAAIFFRKLFCLISEVLGNLYSCFI